MRPKGIIPAVLTPFTESEEVSEEALKQLLEYLIVKGVHGVFVVGTAGEFYALSAEEKARIFKAAVAAANGRVPVYAGTAAETTRDSVKLGHAAREAGVDFISVLTPWFARLSQEELYEHYRTIAEEVGLPMLLYNNPDRAGNDLATQTVARLARNCENVVGIKDSTGDLTQTLDYIAHCPAEFSVIMGRDTLIYAALMEGAAGAIAATGNVVPELCVGIYEDVKAGRLEQAVEKQRRLHLVRKAMVGNPAATLKAMAELRGLKLGPPRSPLTRPPKEQVESLRVALQKAGVLQ
jgi:4-hydroxy-tetrahydrodipicolinate synthase